MVFVSDCDGIPGRKKLFRQLFDPNDSFLKHQHIVTWRNSLKISRVKQKLKVHADNVADRRSTRPTDAALCRSRANRLLMPSVRLSTVDR